MGLCPGVDLGVYHRPRDQPHRILKNTQPHLERSHAHEPVHAELTHVQHPRIKRPGDHEPVRTFLGRLPKHKHRRVVFLRPKLERGRILERTDVVFL
jgi:hypothetical protein